MSELIAELKKVAHELLESGQVKAIVGYAAASLPDKTTPVIITSPAQVERLVWNKFCLNNLALYLTRPEVTRHGKIGLVLKGCDAKAACVLLQEAQISRQDVVLIGIACDGVGEPLLTQCKHCDVHTPRHCDRVLGQAGLTDAAPDFSEVAHMENLPLDQRWAFWQRQFERCIKCYACRQACPLCYCKRCVVEKNQPQWIASSAHARGNFAWNVIRAMHLAGRCVGCGACQRACPQDLPLMLLNTKMAKEVATQFKYRPGYDPAVPAAVKTFDEKGDCDDMFR